MKIKIFNKFYMENFSLWGHKEFKAPYGWTRKFRYRKNISHRKQKKGREKKSKEFVPQVEMFIGNLLYEFLQTMEEDGTEGRS